MLKISHILSQSLQKIIYHLKLSCNTHAAEKAEMTQPATILCSS